MHIVSFEVHTKLNLISIGTSSPLIAFSSPQDLQGRRGISDIWRLASEVGGEEDGGRRGLARIWEPGSCCRGSADTITAYLIVCV